MITHHLKLLTHLLAGLCAELWQSKATVMWDSVGTIEEFIKLIMGNASFAQFIRLTKAIEDKVVE